MNYKQINVKSDTHTKIKDLSVRYNVKIYKLVDIIVSFFDENKTIISADFFQKSENTSREVLKQNLERSFQKIIRKEINRVIGFIKTQDKFMKSMKKDIIFKMIDEDTEEYNPLFNDYEYQIYTYQNILKDFGINSEEKIFEYIEKKGGISELNYFVESYEKTKQKKMFIDL